MELKVKQGKGYLGKLGRRCWVARILGADPQYGLRREFIEPAHVGREHFNRVRSIVNFTYNLDPGLYEISEAGERRIVVVWRAKDGTDKSFCPSDERVNKMLALMDGGMSADDARRATKQDVSKEKLLEGV
jgi:hypothetical protein